jgi:GNAT superfamily N-acetyltransferase
VLWTKLPSSAGEQPEEIAALMERTELEFAGFGHRRFDIDPLTPPSFAAWLAMAGTYTVSEELILILDGDLPVQSKAYETREVASQEEWQLHSTLHAIWEQESPDWDEVFNEGKVTRRLARGHGARFWMAFADDAPGAVINSWPGDNGVGMVEDLFTHPDYRRRGLATALIAHGIADIRARSAGPVVIGADPGDPTKQMYFAMGFGR